MEVARSCPEARRPPSPRRRPIAVLGAVELDSNQNPTASRRLTPYASANLRSTLSVLELADAAGLSRVSSVAPFEAHDARTRVHVAKSSSLFAFASRWSIEMTKTEYP